MIKTVECDLGGRPLVMETGRVAKQADGAVVVRYGDTMVLCTAVSSQSGREGIDFFPLTVDYQEFSWAAGRIPGNFFRREIGRPSAKETLTSRVIDRPLRPRFPKGYRNETQIICNVLSSDTENDGDVLALLGACTAVCISDIPWQGPVAGCRVGRVDGEFVINPTQTELEESDINIIIAASPEALVMVEGEAEFVPDEEIQEAIFFAQDALKPVFEAQQELIAAVGREKRPFTTPVQDDELAAKIKDLVYDDLKTAVTIKEKLPRYAAVDKVKAALIEKLGEDYKDRVKEAKELFGDLKAEIVRTMIINDKVRIDGRDLTTVRPISIELGILPRAHGSALFTRGETQALVTTTLGTSGDEQRIESIMGDSTKDFFLHYNFPPFSVNEAKMLRGPSRRDIGHGNLAERAITPTLPTHDEFQYTLRVVSDILESNGSSSMATVCGGSLSLMDAGVPVSGPVAGVAMGLIQEGDQVAVLTDILGDEDHLGDMDFKVAGSEDGVTAIQMDIKLPEISREVMRTAMTQAKDGRNHILGIMKEAITGHRDEVSPFAPRIVTIQIKPERIRDIIGPGGKVIKGIQADTGSKIDIEDSGKVMIAAADRESVEAAINFIKDLTREPEIGAVYTGPVKRVTDFGAFVEIMPGIEGLLHISELDHYRVDKVTDILQEGDQVTVKCLNLEPGGKIRLSRKALIEPPADMPPRDDRGGRDGDRGGRDGDRRNNRSPRGRRGR